MEEKAWWQKGSDRSFRAQLGTMSEAELESTASEIAGALSVIQAQIETSSDRTSEWYQRARQALGFIAARKALLRAELTVRNANNQALKDAAKRENIRIARAALERGDLAAALRIVLDQMEFGPKGRPKTGEVP